MLTSAEIQRMRDTQEGALPDVLYVLERTTTMEGGYPVTAEAPEGPYPCRISPITSDEERVVDSKITARPEMQLTYSQPVALATSKAVQVNGIKYEVLTAEDPHEWATAGRAELRRLI